MRRSALIALMILLLVYSIFQATASKKQAPEARFGHRMVYDSFNKRTLLYGGSIEDSETVYFDDTWTFDAFKNEWTKLNPATKPLGRISPGLAYDSDDQVVVLFGGFGGSGTGNRLSDTWLFDVKTGNWREANPSRSPQARSDMGITYDPSLKKVILFGGLNDKTPGVLDDTWVYDIPSNSWTELKPVSKPKPQYGLSIVYDPVNEKTLLYEGHWIISWPTEHGYDGGVWTYNSTGNMWMKINPEASPIGRYWFGAAFNQDKAEMVVFGGAQTSVLPTENTDIYNSSQNIWKKIAGAYNPPKRILNFMAYDAENKEIIMFGGAVSSTSQNGLISFKALGDTWVLNSAGVWTEIATQNTGGISSIPGYPLESILIGAISFIALLLIFRNGARSSP
jgi:N-acetylneuraminic acid mutarotase